MPLPADLRCRSLPPAADKCTPQYLTNRELEVLRLVADGLTAHAIGRLLGISAATASKHLQRVYNKLDVHDRLMAARRAQESGILDGWTGRA